MTSRKLNEDDLHDEDHFTFGHRMRDFREGYPKREFKTIEYIEYAWHPPLPLKQFEPGGLISVVGFVEENEWVLYVYLSPEETTYHYAAIHKSWVITRTKLVDRADIESDAYKKARRPVR